MKKQKLTEKEIIKRIFLWLFFGILSLLGSVWIFGLVAVLGFFLICLFLSPFIFLLVGLNNAGKKIPNDYFTRRPGQGQGGQQRNGRNRSAWEDYDLSNVSSRCFSDDSSSSSSSSFDSSSIWDNSTDYTHDPNYSFMEGNVYHHIHHDD